ncbi:Peroxin-3 [Gorgonomyces haynaldii]|nr:Peroxin-3 [Gorgonomyces haynaldii]
MISKGGFLDRNKNRFAILCSVLGSGYLLVKWATHSFMEQQKQREKEHCSKANITRRFEQNLMDIEFVVSSLVPSLQDRLNARINLELVTAKLQEQKQLDNMSKTQKMELWEQIKLGSFTRTLSAIYLLNLLTLLTTLQLSLLGRMFYLDSVAAMHADDVHRTISEETERKYLTLSWYLVHIGWTKLVDRVEKAVEHIVKEVSLKTGVTFESLSDMIHQIRVFVEYQDVTLKDRLPMHEWLLPPQGEEKHLFTQAGVDVSQPDPELDNLMNETRDFLESPDFNTVLQVCLTKSFDVLLSQYRPTFYSTDIVERHNEGRIQFEAGPIETEQSPIPSKSLPLARVLTVVSKSVHSIGNGVPNVFLSELLGCPQLKAYAVVAYSGWDQ